MRLIYALLLFALLPSVYAEPTIYAPQTAHVNSVVDVVVIANGVVVAGNVDVTSPSNKTTVYAYGKAKFNASERGVWKIKYGSRVAEVEVIGGPESPNLSFLLPLALLAFLAAFIYYLFTLQPSGLSITKEFDGGKVSLVVENSGEDLLDAEITDVLPADAKWWGAREAGAEHTVLGTHLRWKIKLLKKGERAEIAYGLKTVASMLKAARIDAYTNEGKEVRKFSNELFFEG